MCPPVSPHKGASIVSLPTHNACIFWYGNAAARTFGRAHRHRPYHSNTYRRSAKVKTKILVLAELPQIVKLKIWCLRSFRKWQNKKFGACGASANSKTENLVLAELPQMAKQKIWCLRSFRNGENRKFSACGASANGKTRNLALAELPQAFRKKE